jgi:hypothetical protein
MAASLLGDGNVLEDEKMEEGSGEVGKGLFGEGGASRLLILLTETGLVSLSDQKFGHLGTLVLSRM